MGGRNVRRSAAGILLALVLGVSAGCTTLTGTAPGREWTPTGSGGQVTAALSELEVKGRAPKTGYTREEFGQSWADVDRNGCDTRNDILRRDATEVVTRPGTDGCLVESAVVHDRYSDTAVPMTRGDGQVDIDHVVALSDAWQKGAQQWSVDKRTEFANDPLNLVATRSDLNRQKGDGDAATWLPPARSARCPYVARQVAVKRTYGLWVTAAERDAIQAILVTCPDQSLPTGLETPDPASRTAPATEPSTEAGASEAGASEGGGVHYPSCAAAREAGAAPLHAGDPGYREGLDGDRDGIACE